MSSPDARAEPTTVGIVGKAQKPRRAMLRPALIYATIFALGSLLYAQGRNVLPDAVSRATEWNNPEGDLTLLVDGKVPTRDDDAIPFVWNTKGILVFEWPRELSLEKVRIFVGEVGNNYQVRAYRGGRLDESGALREPEGEQTALVMEDRRLINQWVEIPLPPGTLADNIELWTLGPTEFFEVEVLGAASQTAVPPSSWARIKRAAKRETNQAGSS